MTSRRRSVRGSSWRLALMVGVAFAVLLVDQVTKQIVIDRLGPTGDLTSVQIISGVLQLIYVENTGAAFGIFRGSSPVLTFLALGVISFLLFYFRRVVRQSSWLALALGLQLGGAIGNIVDRVRHGFVVDFIDVPRWPTFNLADSAVTVGVVVLGFYLLTQAPQEQQVSRLPAAEGGINGRKSQDDPA